MSTSELAGPFTYQKALAAGITESKLKNPERYRRLFRGVYVHSAAALSIRTRAEAALLLHPVGAFASHSTAAALRGIVVPDDPDVHVTVPSHRHRRRRPGLRVHVREGAQVAHDAGVPTSAGVELFAELAQELTLLDLVIAGDAMVAKGAISLRALVKFDGRSCAAVHRAATLVRARVESPMETRVRLLLHWAGFPEPTINLVLQHSSGSYRPDLCWPELRFAVEYDGQHHRSDLDQWETDIRRREWFQRHGWTIVTLISRDVFRRPAETVQRIYESWVAAGGAPFGLRDDWRPHLGHTPAA